MGLIRRTKQRDAIEDVLSESQDFQSARQIHLALANSGSNIGLATVYRNLQGMTEAKIVEAIRSEDGEFLYKLCDTVAHHHHLVCRECGKTIDVADDKFERWVEEIAKSYGFTEVEHSADMFGLCAQCS